VWTVSSTWEVCCPWDGHWRPDINRHIGLASSVMSALHNIWKDRYLSISTKIRIYQALVQSVLLYAAETWTPLPTDIKALEAFRIKCQRQLLQISWQQFIRNDRSQRLPACRRSRKSSAAIVAPSSVMSRDYHKMSRRTKPSTATSTCLSADHPTTSGNAARADPGAMD